MENKLKSFWDRPEGMLGKITTLGILGGLVWGLYKLLPYAVELAENTLYLFGLLAAIGTILFLAFDPKVRGLIWYMFQSVMRFITGIFITIDPIGILKNYVEDLKTKREKMEESISQVNGQLGQLKRNIEEREKQRDKKLQLSLQADKDPNRKVEAMSLAGQSAKLDGYVKKMQSLASKIELVVKTLNDMKYYSSVMITNTEFEVEMREDEYKTIKKSHSAMRSAMSIINGDKDKRAIFEESMAFVIDDTGFKIGEMDRMMAISSDFINSVNLEDGIANDQGLKLLEEAKQKGLQNIFGVNGTNNIIEPVKITVLPQSGDFTSKYLD